MQFSIITITKNNSEGLSRTETSVKSQTYKDYEWIVIDGVKENDTGIYNAMNKGIERSKGDYLIFMNAGDEFANSKILKKISKLEFDFIFGDSIEDGNLKKAKPAHKIKYGMITHHQAMVYKRSAMDNLRYDEEYKLAADYKFSLEFLAKTNDIAYLPIPICIFEVGGISQTQAAIARREEKKIRKELNLRIPLITFKQLIASLIKKHCPIVYWKLRS